MDLADAIALLRDQIAEAQDRIAGSAGAGECYSHWGRSRWNSVWN
ncbi:hypothetical protein [Streptomyces sp. NPDC058086]